MKKLNYFSTREECKEFLDKFGFKYEIPELENHNTYYVQLNDRCTKVEYCAREEIYDNMVWHFAPFYERTYEMIEKDGKWVRRYPLAK